MRGDLDGDVRFTAADIDLLYDRIRRNSAPEFDWNDDEQFDQQDLDELVWNTLQTQYGDVDLNGDIDRIVFVQLAMNYGKTNTGWSGGDFDDDLSVTFSDLLTLAIHFGFAKENPRRQRPRLLCHARPHLIEGSLT